MSATKLAMDDLQLQIYEKDGVVYTDSRQVAEVFGKRHADVLRACDNLLKSLTDATLRWLRPCEYVDAKGESRRFCEMTKDGFAMLAMGFTGDKATEFKIRYIDRFNQMERLLRSGGSGDPVTDLLEGALVIRREQRVQAEKIALLEDKSENLEARQETVEEELARVKAELPHISDHYSVMAYAKNTGCIHDSRFKTPKFAEGLGRRASKLSREEGRDILSIPDPRWGAVNAYDQDVIHQVFVNVGLLDGDRPLPSGHCPGPSVGNSAA